ncbi:unnamed protein product, partial [Rotaria sp. Silwood1]
MSSCIQAEQLHPVFGPQRPSQHLQDIPSRKPPQ